MTYYLRNGAEVRITDESAINISTTLEPGNYVVKYDKRQEEFYLERSDSFEPLPKYYGDLIKNRDRVLNTFRDRPFSTGVMMVGEKGSGKTLLAKEVSIQGYKFGYPTILINQMWKGDEFNKFIQDIEQEAIVIFDEFEKIYRGQDQEEILTLFDGVYPSKKLFIVSCNDKWKVDGHMRNRPGRFYYYFEFSGIESEFVVEYCLDRGLTQTQADDVARVASIFGKFNFDMLKAIVEEMIRYDETAEDVLRVINARPELDTETKYNAVLTKNGSTIKIYNFQDGNKNPMTEAINIHYDNEDDEFTHVKFDPTNISHFDGTTGSYVFKKDDYLLTLTRASNPIFDWRNRI